MPDEVSVGIEPNEIVIFQLPNRFVKEAELEEVALLVKMAGIVEANLVERPVRPDMKVFEDPDTACGIDTSLHHLTVGAVDHRPEAILIFH
jgi:hypothetical protein